MNRPKNVAFWTGADVARWIAANVKSEGRDDDTPKGKALWWEAYRQAAAMCETNRVRDWADLLVGGVKPMRLQDLTHSLQATHEDIVYAQWAGQTTCTHEEADQAVLDELREFWGVSK